MPRLTRALTALTLLAAPAAAAPPPDLDARVDRTLAMFGVPGAAVAIVEPGQVTARGYGLRKLGEPARVDAHTIFPIGSNTKAFTAAALAILVDEGRLHWEDRVEDRLPGFRLYDAYASHELTVRDLLTHRSGLGKGEGDLLVFPETTYTRSEIVERLRYLKPKTSFRERFAYDNVLYIVAGALVEHVSGQRWEDFVRARIFAPLGMTDTQPNFARIATSNRGWPHARVTGRVRGLGPVTALPAVPAIDNVAPAGAINASAADLTRWLALQLHAGTLPGGPRLWSPARTAEMWEPHVIEPMPAPAPEFADTRPNLRAYALGWTITDYHGERVITHDGGVYGGISKVVLLPDRGVAFAVVTNAEEHFAVDAVAYDLLDHYLGRPATDWAARGKAVRDRALADATKIVNTALAPRAVNPPLPLQTYAGVYRDPWYGPITVARTAAGLTLSFDHSHGMSGPLVPFDHDTFRTEFTDPAIENAYVTFAIGPDGRVTGMSLKPVSPLADFSFDYADLAPVPDRWDDAPPPRSRHLANKDQ